jgi:hypothetical protein
MSGLLIHIAAVAGVDVKLGLLGFHFHLFDLSQGMLSCDGI